MAVEKGWLEQRRQERISASVNVNYRVLNDGEKEAVLREPRYSGTTTPQLPHLANKFHVYHAVTQDISEGGLSVIGERSFAIGEWVEISILPPKYTVPVTMLAEVKWARSFSQLGKSLHTAGVSILALDSDSMDRLSRYLLAEKVRRDNNKSN